MTSGAFALLIGYLVREQPLNVALDLTLAFLANKPDAGETVHLLEKVAVLAQGANGGQAGIESLGEGWIAEEALAMGLYAALAFRDHNQGIDALSRSFSWGRQRLHGFHLRKHFGCTTW